VVTDNKQLTQGVEYHAKTLAAELLPGTSETEAGVADLEELESHFREAKSPDQWNQNLFHLERIARLARQYNASNLAKHTAEQMIKMSVLRGFALCSCPRQSARRLYSRR